MDRGHVVLEIGAMGLRLGPWGRDRGHGVGIGAVPWVRGSAMG